jgi:hypothetical protein
LTETRSVRNKAAKWVFAALVALQAQFPFPVLGIDSDNGSEFINAPPAALVSRPADHLHPVPSQHSNDGCHVEQKNWTVVRRTAGYWRYQTPREMSALNQIRTALAPLTNLFTPQQKLATKTRIGAKVTKTYDTAQTPYQRLLTHRDALDDTDAKLLAKRFATLNPAQARRDITDLQKSLLGMVAHQNTTRRGKQNAVYLSRAKFDESTTHPSRAS